MVFLHEIKYKIKKIQSIIKIKVFLDTYQSQASYTDLSLPPPSTSINLLSGNSAHMKFCTVPLCPLSKCILIS